MSHFKAYTSLMPIGKADKTSAYFKDHYLQVIAYNRYDGFLYGIDENHLVRFKDGMLEQVYDLGEMTYKRDEFMREDISESLKKARVLRIGLWPDTKS
ncbi:MAG: hypothetical protein AB1390_12340 [Nitrospirota bacterium]